MADRILIMHIVHPGQSCVVGATSESVGLYYKTVKSYLRTVSKHQNGQLPFLRRRKKNSKRVPKG
jgi:hypothetical protein